MSCFDNLTSENGTPCLIPIFKQTERRLLSVFMSLLGLSPTIRGHFLGFCGYRGGANVDL